MGFGTNYEPLAFSIQLFKHRQSLGNDENVMIGKTIYKLKWLNIFHYGKHKPYQKADNCIKSPECYQKYIAKLFRVQPLA